MRSNKSYDKKDDCKRNHFRKKVMRPCTMTSPQAPAIHPKEGVNLVLDHLCTHVLVLGLALAQAAGATVTIMLIKMIASRVQHPSKGIYPSMGTYSSDSDDSGCIHHPDKGNTIFATFSDSNAKKKRAQK
jgi:hypothetical protein